MRIVEETENGYKYIDNGEGWSDLDYTECDTLDEALNTDDDIHVIYLDGDEDFYNND